MEKVRKEKKHILVLTSQLSILILGKLMNLSAPHFCNLESGHFSCNKYEFSGINITNMANLTIHS